MRDGIHFWKDKVDFAWVQIYSRGPEKKLLASGESPLFTFLPQAYSGLVKRIAQWTWRQSFFLNSDKLSSAAMEVTFCLLLPQVEKLGKSNSWVLKEDIYTMI